MKLRLWRAVQLWGSGSVIYRVILSPPRAWWATGHCPPALQKEMGMLPLHVAWLWHSLPAGDTEVLPGHRAGSPGLRRAPALWPAALLRLRELHTLSRGWCLLHPPLLIQVSVPPLPADSALSPELPSQPPPCLCLPPCSFYGLRFGPETEPRDKTEEP